MKGAIEAGKWVEEMVRSALFVDVRFVNWVDFVLLMRFEFGICIFIKGVGCIC